MSMQPLEGKTILITGGTGSLGQRLTHRILNGEMGTPDKVIIFSRDEARQHQMRLDFHHQTVATDEVIFKNFQELLEFRIGDIRSPDAVVPLLRGVDVVFNAAAMKQVPTCEYFPYQAALTNVAGAENIVKAIESFQLPVETVVGISTDKAVKPVNVMGMTKAIQERVFTNANIRVPGTRFVGVRYGNVLASRGSVIPLFHDQIRVGGPVTITTPEMTRFLLSLNEAVDTVFAAVRDARAGEILVPDVPSALMTDVATALIGDRDIEIKITGIRPGEKIHEIMVSDEEAPRTIRRGKWIAVRPMVPELYGPEEAEAEPAVRGEFSSAGSLLSLDETRSLLEHHGLMVEQRGSSEAELLR